MHVICYSVSVRGHRYALQFAGLDIRDSLFKLLENEKDIVIKHSAHSRESRRKATQGMHTSKSCFYLAGNTPSACRLFDAIVSLCVAVIISDYIELPFEDVIDYMKIAVFVDSNSAIEPGYLVKLLRRVKAERMSEYQEEWNCLAGMINSRNCCIYLFRRGCDKSGHLQSFFQ